MILDYPCPTCGAKAGAPCHIPGVSNADLCHGARGKPPEPAAPISYHAIGGTEGHATFTVETFYKCVCGYCADTREILNAHHDRMRAPAPRSS